MSRTNTTTPYEHWNIRQVTVSYGPPWGPYYGERFVDSHGVGNEMYDLRFYAGCKRQPQVVHREVRTYGWANKIHLGPRIAAGYASHRRNVVRTAEREYNDAAAKLWNAGEDVDDLLEPADSRHGAVLWDIW